VRELLKCPRRKSQSATIKAALKAAIALFTKNAADASSKI